MQNELPYRLTERCFRTYEKIIEHAVNVMPSRFNIPPVPGRSSATVEARLRDALRSLHTYKWGTSVNMQKFNEYYPQLMVTRDGEDVVIELRRRNDPAVLSPRTTAELLVSRDKVSEVVIKAVVTLAHAGVLNGVCLAETKAEVVQPHAVGHDVAVVEKDGNTIII